MKELAEVERTAAVLGLARAEFVQAMREAVDAGASLTAVGEAAGLSRSRVWQIVKSERSES